MLTTETLLDGSRHRVVALVTERGDCPATEAMDAAPPEELARVLRAIKELANGKRVRSKQRYRKIGGPIWEAKGRKLRVFLFRHRNQIVLTNGYMKQKRKADKRQINIARSLYREYTGREP